MTTKNPLNIDFANITKAAERRVTNLEAIGEIVAHNAESMFHAMTEVNSVLKLLAVRWDALDPEGRALLPKPIQAVIGNHQAYTLRAESLLGAESGSTINWGLMHLRQFAAPATVQAKHDAKLAYVLPGTESDDAVMTGTYKIEIAFASTSDTKTISEALQEVYDSNGPAGRFNVKTNGTYCWITFHRELSDDRDYILQRIAKDMTLTPDTAACNQLTDEFMDATNDPDHEGLVGSILEALATAQVEWPQP